MDRDALFPSGKYAGKTAEWGWFNDPDHMHWLIRSGALHPVLVETQPFSRRLSVLHRRVSYLRLPGLCGWCASRERTAMWLTPHASGGLAQVEFTCESCWSPDMTRSVRTRPSFCNPSLFKRYDKRGGDILVATIRHAYGLTGRLTQKKMFGFFETPANFVSF